MAKSDILKGRLLYLADIFRKYTDENTGITMPDIMNELSKNGIEADRKTIYSDIEALRLYGMEIEGVQRNHKFYYHWLNPEFELAELKMLVDVVQSSKFITQKKSSELIKKIEGLTNVHNARQLQRSVVIRDRIKTMNESILYNVDAINNAINENISISFEYLSWNLKKQLVPKENSVKQYISPWVLMWDDENYYLVAYDDEAEVLKHYRVDKMRNIVLTGRERCGREEFAIFNEAKYAKKVFGMFGGEEVNVSMEFDNKLIGVVLDRFGTDVMVVPVDSEHFRVHVDVEVSNVFFGWLAGLGTQAKLVAPDNVVKDFKSYIGDVLKLYK